MEGAVIEGKANDIDFMANHDINILGQSLTKYNILNENSTTNNIFSSTHTVKNNKRALTEVSESLISNRNVRMKAGKKDKKVGNINIIGSGVV